MAIFANNLENGAQLSEKQTWAQMQIYDESWELELDLLTWIKGEYVRPINS